MSEIYPESPMGEPVTAGPVIAVTTDGDTLWLQCFRDDMNADHGITIAPVEPGDDFAVLAAMVAEHQREHGCTVTAGRPATPAMTPGQAAFRDRVGTQPAVRLSAPGTPSADSETPTEARDRWRRTAEVIADQRDALRREIIGKGEELKQAREQRDQLRAAIDSIAAAREMRADGELTDGGFATVVSDALDVLAAQQEDPDA